MTTVDWPYPGARWWKFDFHTHTPASLDTSAWQEAKGTAGEVTPEKWLLKYMAVGIDCVAITDHNSGAWVDALKDAYEQMAARYVTEEVEGFRELALFPGVEISANGGAHILAIFDRSATTSDVDSLLGAVGYTGTKGDSDAETSVSIEQVIQKIVGAGAIPIPAHADGLKGLLRVEPGANKPAISPHTIKQALAVDGLSAIEWTDERDGFPACVDAQAQQLAKVLGSDCHNFQKKPLPGSRYTWVKMARPSLEGLRLALLDGDESSLRRVEDGSLDDFKPFKVPEHLITAIEVKNARVMGRNKSTRMECSPFFNTIIGGRGTGKSTLVHALRLATGRGEELPRGEPRRQFDAFQTISKNRNDSGALLQDTQISVEWQHDGRRYRLRWQAGTKDVVVEECGTSGRDSGWELSASQAVNVSRFPVRILSQGQIAAMAGGARTGLLSIIDESAGVEPLKSAFAEAQRTFYAQRARLRELEGRLAALPEVERKLAEVVRKLKALAQADDAQVLQAYAKARRQTRVVKATFEQLRADAAELALVPDRLVIDDWPEAYFDENDAAALAWRRELENKLASMRQRLEEVAREFASLVETEAKDTRLLEWEQGAEAAKQAHAALQTQLAEQGVEDPSAFRRLTQEQQQFESQLKELLKVRGDQASLMQQLELQQTLLLERREAITEARKIFLETTISNNQHVRMAVIPMGFDSEVVEQELRELLGVDDERQRFADDLLVTEDGQPASGMVADLVNTGDLQKASVLDSIKDRLIHPDERVGGHFKNFLVRAAEKPEFVDHVLVWFPEDDLRIEYQRQDKWHSIREGSQGQRSAALLAFLLAFGNEPIVLDQPEDDLDNHLIYDLIVQQIRQNKLRRQLIVVTHNANVVVNGDADLVHVMDFHGQCYVKESGALQEMPVREEVCRVMEGGREAFSRRWKRLGKGI